MFAVLCQASGALAQQPTAPAAQIQGQTMTPTAADVVRESGSSASTVAKSVTVGLRELSPCLLWVKSGRCQSIQRPRLRVAERAMARPIQASSPY